MAMKLAHLPAVVETILLATVTLLAEATPRQATQTSILAPSVQHAEGELLVKFKEGPWSDAAGLAHAGLGTEVSRTFGEIGWQCVKLPPGMSVADGLGYYRALETVAAVEPNHVRRVAGTVPDDPRFNEQWNLRKIGATNAWTVTTGSSNLVVAIIDTGVTYDHEDLAANMWRNPGESGLDSSGNEKAVNGADDDGNGYVDDVYGIDAYNHDSNPMDSPFTIPQFTFPLYHGTMVAGILGGRGNNGRGIAGLNWNLQIMALKSHGGSTASAFDSAVIECFEYVIMMKKRGVNIRVVNNSYGGDEIGQAIKDAIDAAGNLGILNVFVAGNNAQNNDATPFYPASFDSPSILSVAATDLSDNLWGNSNYGRKSVDLAAPGAGVLSTTVSNGYQPGLSGTSFAVPHVVGAATLLLAVNPDLSVADLKSALLGTVDFLPSLTNRVASNGRLNVARALQFLVASNAPPTVTSALPAGNRTPLTTPVELIFTKPMDRASVEAGFSVSPAVTGSFEWSNNDRTVRFTPAAPWSVATSYAGKLLGSVRDTNGMSLDGNYNRAAQGANWDDFTWGFRTTPANDDFADAQPISGTAGGVTGTNRNATQEPGEPDHARNGGGASIWHRWTAPSSDWVTFDTAGTKFDTLLAVYAGDHLETMTVIASNDDHSNLKTSRLSFAPVAGTNYFIAVDGRIFADINRDAPPMGGIVLNWYPTPPPAFLSGTAFTPGEGVWGTQVTLYGTNFTGATNVLFDGVGARFTNIANLLLTDLRLIATVPLGAGSGPITVQTPHGNVTSTTNFGAQSKVFYTVSRSEPALWLDWVGSGFALESTESLATPSWQPVPQTPTPVEGGTRTVVVLPWDAPAKFFRWRRE